MKRVARQSGLLFAALALAGPLGAQQPEIKLSGQVRPRLEGRTPVDGSWDFFTSMRARAALAAGLEGRVRVFLQFQDVRTFGEEGNTLGDYRADNFDLHQGYLELGSVPKVGGLLRVGRQELVLGEQRLVGAVDWSQQGRSFDGARYTTRALGRFRLDFFGMKLRDETAETQEFDSNFLGGWGTLDLEKAGTLDLFGLFVTDSRDQGSDLRTFGGLWRANAGPLRLRVEGSLQGGSTGDEDVSAYMVGISAGGNITDRGTVTVLYDFLSGDEDPDDGEWGVFNTLFATNHIFYGLADYFTDIPAHTGGLGLRDLGVKFSVSPGTETRLGVDLHHFRTATEGPLSTQALGNELDLTLTRRITRELGLTTGYSFFQAKEGIQELGRLSENGHWLYLMLNAAF
ncbi:MAG: alginate export family protein [Longimicrobiales bacterium]